MPLSPFFRGRATVRAFGASTRRASTTKKAKGLLAQRLGAHTHNSCWKPTQNSASAEFCGNRARRKKYHRACLPQNTADAELCAGHAQQPSHRVMLEEATSDQKLVPCTKSPAKQVWTSANRAARSRLAASWPKVSQGRPRSPASITPRCYGIRQWPRISPCPTRRFSSYFF